MCADDHNPTPAIETKRFSRHQQIGQKCHDWHGHEANRLFTRKSAPANLLRHKLRDIRANGHHLQTDTKARHESPEVQTCGRSLKCHDQVRNCIDKQRIGKNCTPSKTVGEEPATDRSYKKPQEEYRNEASHPLGAEQAVGDGIQDATLDESRGNVP